MGKLDRLDVNAYTGKFDVQYSTASPTCLLDIYLPQSHDKPYPVIVSIHGGAFKKCDKRDKEMIEPMLLGLDLGYAVVGVNYRLSGEAQFPEPLKDIKQALRFIHDNAHNYNFDPTNIVVWGGSAGGYFSLMSGCITDDPYFDESFSSSTRPSISGIVSWFPPISFELMDHDLKELGLLEKSPDHSADNSPESLFLGEPVLKSTDKLARSNPINYINESLPPMLIQHGSVDRVVPYKQSERFVKATDTFGFAQGHITYQVLENANHGDIAFEQPDNLEVVYDFIARCFNR
ncbi:hypothetical protein AOC36_05625 [Erysipelothrix larvae]|uniref:BD-FAE-like domain-containing protein n=1 Tax=Erysipelothrix larvae TaxID=1514105 RepID=A0A0X8GZV6_9FIRM|nr:alpha/beta hydrolase [Erysipelothrix larvae]AMC93476.1 hypothetical protein AOC36_05625 [Erysipelothrix larvae]